MIPTFIAHLTLWIYLISSVLSLAIPSVDNLDELDLHINSVLRSSNKFKDLPPLIPIPSKDERTLKQGEIPSFVTDYCPLVHLYSEERYLPYDIKDFVTNFHAEFANGTKIPGFEERLNITSLHKLQKFNKDESIFNGPQIYMTANEDFDKDPEWITGEFNKPKYLTGEIPNAPATLIVVDKGNGWVDAFWFYFYSFNLGPFVMGFGPYGNHVGDWEHSLVRFYNGEPIIVWMSAHGGGGAYYYHNIEKSLVDNKKPVIFSARGTHANYPSVGQHAHDLPYSILSDFTDRGPLWDPSRNFLAYTYDGEEIYIANGSHPFRESSLYGKKWLTYLGPWGDKKLPPTDPRQHWSPWEWKYIDGPCGPMCKNLLRTSPCQRSKWWNFVNMCNIRYYVKMGEGIESEGNNSCGNIFRFINDEYLFGWILLKFFELLTWNGWFCYIMDFLFG